MPDVIDTLRAADPAASTQTRASLDGRAESELHALLVSGDDLAARRRRGIPRRWAVPGAAAAAVAVLLTGTFGAGQIAALRGHDAPSRSALADPGSGTSAGGASGVLDADTQQRMQATLDAFRAAKAKTTAPRLFGAPSGRDFIEAQLRLDPSYDPAVVEAVRAGRLAGVPIQPAWVAAWDAFRARAVPGAPAFLPTGVAPTHVPKNTRVQVTTATGTVELAGLDLTMGHEGSGVHLLVPNAEVTSYVDLARADPASRPAFLQGYDASSRRLEAFVIEDENATRGEYAVDVREETDAIVVSVRTIRDSRPAPSPSGGFMRRTRMVPLPTVTLSAPLGGRPLLDAAVVSFVVPPLNEVRFDGK